MRNCLVSILVLLMASSVWGESTSTEPADEQSNPTAEKVSDIAGSCIGLMTEVGDPAQDHTFS